MTDKRRITMTSVSLSDNGVVLTHEATDLVALPDIDVYVADAQTRWQTVTVGDEIISDPDGDYNFPLDIPSEAI